MQMSTNLAAPAEALLVGESRAMGEVRKVIRQVATSNVSVIVTGPSGSGKEMVARAIHAESKRATLPYVAVNCGAIPRDLLESELFGHEKGAFTGATAQRRGRFEEAHGGTLFLDEIGDMPLDMQVKLLRVLEERTVQRVGGRGEIAVDTRIISATHRNIEDAIGHERFREDLFYRLAVFPIHLPSLSERREDIPLLVRHFLRRKTDVQFTQEAMDRLVAHSWTGNVRELRNVLERANIMFPAQTVGAEEVELFLRPSGRQGTDERAAPPFPVIRPAISDEPVDLRSIVAEVEHRYISEALRLSDGVIAEAARLLSLQRTTLIEKMRKYGLAKDAA